MMRSWSCSGCAPRCSPCPLAQRLLIGVVVIVLLVANLAVECRTVRTGGGDHARGRGHGHLSKRDLEKCDIHDNENLHAVMDRFCMECESIFRNSVDQQDIHANCRKNCFANEVFEWCWNQIRPGGVDTFLNLK